MATGTDARVPTAALGEPAQAAEFAAALIHGRHTVLPKRLAAPGPGAQQLELILDAAAAAPDHGELVPWRFVLIPEAARWRLADVFAASLRERDASATDEQLGQAREKAFRGPTLLLAVVQMAGGDDSIPPLERVVSAGCAIQNMLLMATALGFGSALTSGKALQSAGLRQLFSLQAQEEALCFVSFGTIARERAKRPRPATARYVSELVPHP